MNITVDHRDFKTQLLELRAPGFFGLPAILLNGVPVKKIDGAYTVLNDAGQEVLITLRTGPFDELPQLLIEEDEVHLTGKPGWTQFGGWRRSTGFRLLAIFLRKTGVVAASTLRFKKSGRSVRGQ